MSRSLPAVALSVALLGGLAPAPPLRADPIALPHPPVLGAPAALVSSSYGGLTVLTGSGIAQLNGVHR